MRKESIGVRRLVASAAMLSAASFLSGCGDDGSWRAVAKRYDKDILKIDRLDEECQAVEGEGRGSKFYINIIGDSFVRSGFVPLDYTPAGDYPPIVGAPLERVTAHRVANDVAYLLQERDQKAIARGEKRAMMSIDDLRASELTNWGVDKKKYCFSYGKYSNKTNDGFEIHCLNSYDPKDHTLTSSQPELFDYSTDAPIPLDRPQNGYIAHNVARKPGEKWSRTIVTEKAVCRPTEVKLR